MNSFGRNRNRTGSFTMATTHLGASKSDMERDSGFSDASSEYLSAVELTDTEESGRHGAVRRQDSAAQQVAFMGGSYTGMSPMIIMNNFLLKQPSNITPADKQWTISSPLEMMPQSQVVLLQPVVSNGSNCTPKQSCENGRQSRSCTSVKSYPRIAPHPGELVSKRVSSSRLKGPSGHEQRPRKHHHSHRAYSVPSPKAALQTPAPQKGTFEAVNQTHISSAQVCDKAAPALTGIISVPTYTHDYQTAINNSFDTDSTATDSSKQKRFSNTYNILSKSGLLGITMRTKQLIKENRRTQSQLQQLQEQTDLLLEALSSGDAQVWSKLQTSLQDTEKEHSSARISALLL